MESVYEAAPANTLIMVATGHGDTSLAIQKQSEKARREAELDGLPKWTERDELQWAALAEQVVKGLFFATVKKD